MDEVGAREWSTVAPATAGALVLVLAGAALVQEARMPSGPGQVVLVPLVATAFVGVALGAGVPVMARWLLLATSAAWLTGTWVAELLLAHQGLLLLALLALTSRRPSWIDLLAVPLAALVGSGRVVPTVTVLCFLTVVGVALRRRSVEPTGSTAAAVAAGLMATVVAGLSVLAELAPGALHPGVRLVVYEGVLLACGAVIAWGAGNPGGRALTDVTLGDDRATGLDGLQVVLAEALADPTLTIEPITPRSGVPPAALGEGAGGRGRTEVRDAGRVVAVLRHRMATLADPPTRTAVVEAVRLAVAEEERRRELEDRLSELTAARQRVDTAADRRRTEIATLLRRDVLSTVDSVTDDLRALAAADPAANGALLAAVAELESAVHETQRLVWGVPYAGLGEGRIVQALEEVVRRSPVPTTLAVEGVVAAAPEVEAALFYVCAEALVNVHKHASASHAHVVLTAADDEVSLTVVDDGVGGADAHGSGLVGLGDRMAAVGGRLRVDSPPGAGTTVVASAGLTAPGPRARWRGTTTRHPPAR